MHAIVRIAGLSMAAWALLIGRAHAQEPPATDAATRPAEEAPPAEETPPKPVPNTPPAAGYPTALVARPLLLPAGAIEGSVRLIAMRTELVGFFADESAMLTTYQLEPRVRFGLASAELEAAIAIFLLQQVDEDLGFEDPDALQNLYIAARIKRSVDSSVGAEINALNIGSDVPVMRPALTLQRKVHLSPAAAYDSALAVGLQRISPAFDGAASAFLLESRGRIEAQVTPAIAAEGRVTMRYLKPLDDESSFNATSLGFEVGVGVLAAASPMFDVFASVDIVGTGEVDQKVFIVGAASRKVP